jgi:hypothetical protein
MLRTHILYCLIVAATTAFAQEKKMISGNVSDAASKEVLPFATISLKKLLISTATNEGGNFDFLIPENSGSDSLVISYLGYRSKIIPVSKISSPVQITLQQNSTDLKEVIVKPQPPEFYIKLAMLKVKQNYAQQPFENQAYYREKLMENNNFIRCNEGVFKSYCSNYLDSAKSINQLLLFRKEENTREVAFMSKERKKAEEKKKKQDEKDRAKGKTVKENSNSGVKLDLAGAFSGPGEVLSEGNLIRDTESFLDTAEFKHFKYSFAKSSSYDNQELMVIDFKSKDKVDHTRQQGRIYIDVTSHAIVKYTTTGDLVIPLWIRPILFLSGLGVENPTFDKKVEFQKVNNSWYPKAIMMDVWIKLKNKHFFSADEISDFEIESLYIVNKTNIEKPALIPLSKRFDPKKEMDKQVHNDDNLAWEQINIVKK